MTTREQLLRARARVERGWTQHATARKADGLKTHPEHEDAVCWCLEGAAYWSEPGVVSAREALREALGIRYLDVWNDEQGRTQEEVLAAIDAALAKFPEDAPMEKQQP